jgi:hypothetical protein
MTEDEMKTKLQFEKQFTACVIAYDEKGNPTNAYIDLMNSLRRYVNVEGVTVYLKYAREFNHFGMKACEVCTATVIQNF